MTTALQLVTSALRKIGAVAAGEAPDANEQSDALAALNQLIESWNLQGLALYRRENVAYSLVPSQQEQASMRHSRLFQVSRYTPLAAAPTSTARGRSR